MTAGRVVAIVGGRPGAGVTSIAAEVAALAARAGNRVVLAEAGGDDVLAQWLGRDAKLPGPAGMEIRPGLVMVRAPADTAATRDVSVDLVLLDAGSSRRGRRLATEVADHLVLVSAPDGPAIERLAAEAQVVPRSSGHPALLGVVATGLPAHPRGPFSEVRRALRAGLAVPVPVHDRPVRSAPLAAWLARRHGVLVSELLDREDLLPLDHPARWEAAGLASDLRHLGQAMIDAIERAERHPHDGWSVRWRPSTSAPPMH